MSTQLREGNQIFEFDDNWQVNVYDCVESGYRDINKCVGAKSCDFIGVLGADTLALMEVKDFRGYQKKNDDRLDGPLAREMAEKVAHTLAGIASGARRKCNYLPWRKMGELLNAPSKQVLVILFLEDDLGSQNIAEWKAMLSVQRKLMRKNLFWLQVEIAVISESISTTQIPGVVVSSLPGAACHTP